MCNVAFIPAAVAVGQMFLSGMSQMQQTESQAATLQYNARQMENQAERVTQKGTQEEIKHRQMVQQLISTQRAKQAASGLALDSGTFGQIQEQTLEIGEVDALRIRSNYEQERTSLLDQAGLHRKQAKQLIADGPLTALERATAPWALGLSLKTDPFAKAAGLDKKSQPVSKAFGA